jgi:hypothetical protein
MTRFCEFHFSDAYNDVQAEIWERMDQSVKAKSKKTELSIECITVFSFETIPLQE